MANSGFEHQKGAVSQPFVAKLIGAIAIMVCLAIIGLGLYNSGRHAAYNEQKKSDQRTSDQMENVPTSPVPSISHTQPKLPATTQRPNDYSRKLETYHLLQATCDKWKKWYKKDRDENSRVNLNVACRDAANYARLELNENATGYAHIEKANPATTKTATTYRTTENYSNTNCTSWQRSLDNIQQRLRAGYKEPEGNRLRNERTRLSNLISENC